MMNVMTAVSVFLWHFSDKENALILSEQEKPPDMDVFEMSVRIPAVDLYLLGRGYVAQVRKLERTDRLVASLVSRQRPSFDIRQALRCRLHGTASVGAVPPHLPFLATMYSFLLDAAHQSG